MKVRKGFIDGPNKMDSLSADDDKILLYSGQNKTSTMRGLHATPLITIHC